MNRRAFLLSAVATPLAAVMPSPAAPQALNALGCISPGSVVYAPHRLMWMDGNREIQWTAISDAEMWA